MEQRNLESVQDFGSYGLHSFVLVLHRCRFVRDEFSQNGVFAEWV